MSLNIYILYKLYIIKLLYIYSYVLQGCLEGIYNGLYMFTDCMNLKVALFTPVLLEMPAVSELVSPTAACDLV